ncbi:stage II sporulation protein D [Clostridium taeniosporum]|uniref:Stage II sporulation protein D n=1 Tax=Clostridium taeniosporum TaxID=394958 RepID=A0A1D7XGY4_9CLOT|nr:stage II sporulation protein D [Clostridium taeniosporum]AOR22611.1 stage II sporulation protein D [Clostridium taeniosporum]
MKRSKINKDIRLTILVTIIIFVILLLSPVFFLNHNFNIFKPFNIGKSMVNKTFKIELPKDKKVKLYRKDKNRVDEIDIEEYIIGVVASEMPANFDEEALKAQAVAARTYYINKVNNPCKQAENNGGEICDTTHCQVYMDKSERMDKWSKKDRNNNWEKIKKAVKDTEGQVLTYDGKVLEYPQFFAISSGKTESAKDVFSNDVPYLKSTDSRGEEEAPKYKSTVEFKMSEFIKKLKQKYPKIDLSKNNINSSMNIESYTDSGAVKALKICDKTIKGTEFRTLFNLNSTNFNWMIKDGKIKINCTGYGHGVGMSQWGANAMAKEGKKYDEILRHYYTGVDIRNIEYK